MFDKKAQGLSITTIIVAVIGLIVLVVLVAILTGRMSMFSAGLGSAASCENACKAMGRDEILTDKDKSGCKEEDGLHMPGSYEGIEESKVCCCVKG